MLRLPERPTPVSARCLLTNLPFLWTPSSLASSLTEAVAARAGPATAALLTRVAVSDFSVARASEFISVASGGRWLAEPVDAAVTNASSSSLVRRRPRDALNNSRGFALLCFASPSAARSCAAALAGHELGGFAVATQLSDAPVPLLRADREAAAAAAAAADATARERRAGRVPHRRRQRAREQEARTAELEAAVCAALGGVAPPDTVVEAASRVYSTWADGAAALRLGCLDWESAPPAVDPCRGGGLGRTERGLRKRRQVESLLAVIAATKLAPRGCSIADFGCGSGNLTLPLAWALPECDVVAVDAKQRSVSLLNDRIAASGLRNVRAEAGRIETFDRPVGLVLGLHVCGSGTDDAIDVALRQRAAFCVSPCCVGKLNLVRRGGGGGGGGGGAAPARARSASMAARLRLHDGSDDAAVAGASHAAFEVLAAAADWAGHDGVCGYDAAAPCGVLPRAARTAVEADRAQHAREAGFEAHLMKLVVPNASLMDDLVVGWPAGSHAAEQRAILPNTSRVSWSFD